MQELTLAKSERDYSERQAGGGSRFKMLEDKEATAWAKEL
jgi:hypothetical protein